jgi:hypothetical protein
VLCLAERRCLHRPAAMYVSDRSTCLRVPCGSCLVFGRRRQSFSKPTPTSTAEKPPRHLVDLMHTRGLLFTASGLNSQLVACKQIGKALTSTSKVVTPIGFCTDPQQMTCHKRIRTSIVMFIITGGVFATVLACRQWGRCTAPRKSSYCRSLNPVRASYSNSPGRRRVPSSLASRPFRAHPTFGKLLFSLM